MDESDRPRLVLLAPREHGAWVMLVCSLGLGLWAGRPVPAWAAMAVSTLVLGAFVLQESWRRRASARPSRGFALLLAAVATATATLLATGADRALLWPMAAGGALWLAQLGRGRGSALVQVLGVAGFALAAPLACAAGSGDARTGLWLWTVGTLFYCGAVTNVRMVMTAPRRRREGERWLAQPAVRHNLACGALLMVAAAWQATSSPLLALAWLAAAWRVAQGWRWLAAPPPLKRVGLWETAWTLWFTACVAAAL